MFKEAKLGCFPSLREGDEVLDEQLAAEFQGLRICMLLLCYPGARRARMGIDCPVEY